MRTELLMRVNEAVADELAAAKKHFPTNNSRHESYAVLLEEWEEMTDDKNKLEYWLHNIWIGTKCDVAKPRMLNALLEARKYAIEMVAEGIQTAAMIDKFLEYEKGMYDEQPPQEEQPKKRGRKPKVAPVQQEPEIKSVEFVKPDWTEAQKRDIQMIKEAHKAKRAEKKASEDPPKKGRTRSDIDNSLIVHMIDVQGRKYKDIANELGCCEQTVRNRYEQGKREARKGGKA